MSNTVYFGLALTAHNDGVLNTSTFDNMQFVGQVLQQPLSQEVQSGTNVTFTGLISALALLPMAVQRYEHRRRAVHRLHDNQRPAIQRGKLCVARHQSGRHYRHLQCRVDCRRPVIINTQPQNQSVNIGGTANFSVSATANSGTLTYQWQLGGNPISGATSSSFSITNAQPSDAGNYSVMISCPAGSVVSATAVLAVNGAPSSPPNRRARTSR